MVVLDISGVNENDNGCHVICTLGIVNGIVKVVRGNKRLGQELIDRPNMFISANVRTDPGTWMKEFSEYYQGTYVGVGYPYDVPDNEIDGEVL